MLSQARVSISGSRPKQRGTEGSKSARQKSVVCFRCDQPGHYTSECPTRWTSANPAPTQQSQYGQSSQTFRAPPAQFYRGGRGGGSQRGRMAAMEMMEEMSGHQEQPAQLIQYVYPSFAQPSWGGGGYPSGQIAAMETVEEPSTYQYPSTRAIRYVQSSVQQPRRGQMGQTLRSSVQPSRSRGRGTGESRSGQIAAMEIMDEPGTSGGYQSGAAGAW